jgi:hypothetical protein
LNFPKATQGIQITNPTPADYTDPLKLLQQETRIFVIPTILDNTRETGMMRGIAENRVLE